MTIFASCGCEAEMDELVVCEYEDEEIDFDEGKFVPIRVSGVYCRKCAEEGIKKGHLRVVQLNVSENIGK